MKYLSLMIIISLVHAETNISNGKLFLCVDKLILNAKNMRTTTPRKAKITFNNIISEQDSIIARSLPGTKIYKKATKARKVAKKGLSDIKLCLNGKLPLIGDWILLTENGSTPPELGFNSLSLTFKPNKFISIFSSDTLTCNWEGKYTVGENTLSITTEQATGGPSCLSAIGQIRTANVSFNGNNLVLDYRPGGALQEYNQR